MQAQVTSMDEILEIEKERNFAQLEEVFEEEQLNFYETLDAFSFHLRELDKLRRELYGRSR